MDNEFLHFNKNNLAVSYDGPRNASKTVIFLYGGGTVASKDRFKPWQEELARRNTASMSFDYSGCGASSGVFEENSLKKRIDEAVCCTKWIREHNPHTSLTLYGASMGAYTALGVFHEVQAPVSSIILIVPAAYSPDAHTIPFGPTFTKILRKENSWHDSLSFSWIRAFTGTLSIVAAEEDTVVPIEIPKRYMEHATSAKSKSIHVFPGATHTMLGTRNIGKLKELDKIFTLLAALP